MKWSTTPSYWLRSSWHSCCTVGWYCIDEWISSPDVFNAYVLEIPEIFEMPEEKNETLVYDTTEAYILETPEEMNETFVPDTPPAHTNMRIAGFNHLAMSEHTLLNNLDPFGWFACLWRRLRIWGIFREPGLFRLWRPLWMYVRFGSNRCWVQ